MTANHVAQFRELGYAVVREVFGSEDIAALSSAFDRLYAEGMSHPTSFRHGNLCFRVGQDPKIGRVVRMVQWPSYVDPVLEGYRRDPRMLEILEPLIGPDLKQIINQLHWKPPNASVTEFGYHQDIGFRRPRSAYRDPANSYIQTVIAIDPHSRNNGAITVYPGSHRLGELSFPDRGRIMDAAFTQSDLRGLGLDPGQVEHLEMNPGDVALWGLYMVHGSGANQSKIDRRAYVNGYVIAANCDRGEWAFREGRGQPLGEPVLVHYEELFDRPEPHYLEG